MSVPILSHLALFKSHHQSEESKFIGLVRLEERGQSMAIESDDVTFFHDCANSKPFRVMCGYLMLL